MSIKKVIKFKLIKKKKVLKFKCLAKSYQILTQIAFRFEDIKLMNLKKIDDITYL